MCMEHCTFTCKTCLVLYHMLHDFFLSLRILFSWEEVCVLHSCQQSCNVIICNVVYSSRLCTDLEGMEPKSLDPFLEVLVGELLHIYDSTLHDAYAGAPFKAKASILLHVLRGDDGNRKRLFCK